mmetsp:Transcript_24842/g.69255  ORF Transcript_24842/g.69255 Transcript_24842/m.69255 type:complete len:240 (-) Transcript_24842:428-1147(-)
MESRESFSYPQISSMSCLQVSRSVESRRKSVARRSIIFSISDLHSAEKSGFSRFSSRQSLTPALPYLTSLQNFFLSLRHELKRRTFSLMSSAFSTSWRKSSSWQSHDRLARFSRRQSCTRPSPGLTSAQSESASAWHISESMTSVAMSLAASSCVSKISSLHASSSLSFTSRRHVMTAPGSGYRFSSLQYLSALALHATASSKFLLILVALSALKARSSTLQSSDTFFPSVLPFSSSSI